MSAWMFQIGIFDIRYAVNSLHLFLEDPWKGHLKHLVKIFGYSQNSTVRQKDIVISPVDIRDISGKR